MPTSTEQVRRWQKTNPEKYEQIRRRRYTKRRAWLNELKKGPCLDCGRRFPPECMDFDHRDPKSKKFGVGPGLIKRGLNTVLAEIEKCDLVCANCHRTRTAHRFKDSMKLGGA